MKLRTAIFILAAMLCAHTGMAQTTQRRHPIRSKVVWTLVGAAVGTTIGAYAVWDDDERAAVMQDRMRRSMILGGSAGGALGLWFGHHRSRASPLVAYPESPRTRACRECLVQRQATAGEFLLPVPRFPNRALPTRFVLHERDYQTRSAVSMLR
jgi:hypothetical protein